MFPQRVTTRPFSLCLLALSAVLVLGLVQWSFLPILIQNGPVSSSGILEMSGGHSSKFAAPLKCIFGDGMAPCLLQVRLQIQRFTFRIPSAQESVLAGPEVFFLSYHPLRAPPSA